MRAMLAKLRRFGLRAALAKLRRLAVQAAQWLAVVLGALR